MVDSIGGSESPAVGAASLKDIQISPRTSERMQFNSADIEAGLTVDTDKDVIVIDEDGLYETTVHFDFGFFEHRAEVRPSLDTVSGRDLAFTHAVLTRDEYGNSYDSATLSVIKNLSKSDSVYAKLLNDSSNNVSMSYSGTTRLEVKQIV